MKITKEEIDNIDWDTPWEVYDNFLPTKTTEQMLMRLMEEGLGLSHSSDGYYAGAIPDYEGYCLNCREAGTLYDALRGVMVKLFFMREDDSLSYGVAVTGEEFLKEYQEEFLEKLKRF